MEVMHVNLNELASFMAFLTKTCGAFCENQKDIDRAYNAVQDTWRDKNCYVTGQRLRETGEGISRFYDEICVAIAAARKYGDKASRYDGIDPISVSSPEEFRISIRENQSMDNNTIHTDPQALVSFKNALDKYINSIVDSVRLLCSHYNALGTSGAWRDVQYDRFGDALLAFKKKMEEEVRQLSLISEFLRRLIAILEEK